jgi:hypothetical protein
MAPFSFGIHRWIGENGDSQKQREFTVEVFNDNNPENIYLKR